LKKTAIYTTIITSILLLLFGCSTRKDRFLNRAMHGTATKYNVMYNGSVAYDAAKKQIDDNYEDDFFKILPIEPLKIEDKIALPSSPKGPKSLPSIDNSSKSTGGFSKAEEKAVKAIQKHSMNIGGTEKNKQIDDAYFLLGKARYYDQRFVPALETFAYIIKHYPSSPLFNQARIWEAKCATRLGNEDDAIYKLNKVLDLKKTSNLTKHDALTALAMTYTEQDSTQMVINLLDSTLLYKTKNHNQKARNLFILGQLYRKEHKIDSSNIAFEQLKKFKKAPYRFKIHAQLERAKNYNKETDSTAQILASLVKLSKNRDNRPFLDAIYYQLGKINQINSLDDKALDYYKQVLTTKKLHKDIQSFAYEDIGNIKFDKTEFLNAGKYYDSVLSITQNKNTKRIRKLIRKRKSLDELIRLENLASKNDSILDLASMSKEEQTDFFNKYIKALKKKDQELQNIADNKNTTGFENALINPSSKQSAKGGKFYFYSAQTVGFGQAEFKKIWGERALVDNWRLSNKKAVSDNETTTTKDEKEAIIDETKKYDIAYYIGKIPTDEAVLDSISTQRNNAYYKLGLIYKEKFKIDKLATTKLEKLLSFSPDEKMLLPTYYHLYKAYESFDIPKSDFYKAKITTDYPESRYAQLINNPDFVADDTSDENSPENSYKTTYQKYIDEDFANVKTECEQKIITFANLPIVPKFELLKAYAIAKTDDKQAFITALKFVKTNYPNLEEGIHAAKVLDILNGKMPAKEKKKEKTNKPKKKNLKNKVQKKEESLPSKEKMLEIIKKKNKKRNLGPPSRGK